MIYNIESEDDNDLKPRKFNLDQEEKGGEQVQPEEDIPEERIVKDNHFNLLSTRNILGRVGVQRWGSYKQFFFSLDLTKGHMLCFKKQDSKSSTTYYKLSKGVFLKDDEAQDANILKIRTKRNKTLILDVFQEKDINVVTNYISSCFRVKEKDEDVPQYKGYFATLGKGLLMIFSKQFKVTSGILVSEEVSQDAKKCRSPDKVFMDNKELNMIPVTGMFFGSSVVIRDVIGGITQILRLSELISKNQDPNQVSQALQNTPQNAMQDSFFSKSSNVELGNLFSLTAPRPTRNRS